MTIQETARALVHRGKGILAADESNRSAEKRLSSVGVESTEDTRRAYRDLFLGADGVEEYLSGVILYDETLRQNNWDGVPFLRVLADKGILPGIKVDLGSVPLPGFPDEETTQGLDGLPERLREYAELGARFTKWREVIRIGEGIPTPESIHTHAVTLARYARMVQDAGMVPMLEPEVLLEGAHSMERAREVTTWAVSHMFYQCVRYRVDLTGVILKTSMILPGNHSGEERGAEEIADDRKIRLPDVFKQHRPRFQFFEDTGDLVSF